MTASLKDIIKAGARIIDVRSPDEFRDGAYPGAENIPVHLVPARLPDLGPKNQNIVVYCASGGRSAMAARMLKEAGYANVVNAGGLGDMP
jgi:phage shock protein E